MNSHKKENNIERFEQRISNAIIALLTVALTITTLLFIIIFYQNHVQRKLTKLKTIDSAIILFQYNLSEKLSIIASANIFIDFLTSGDITRKDLELPFLTELFPLHSNGISGYSLTNTQTGTIYQSGDKSNQSLTVKLCFLANKLDNQNGNCYGLLKLYFKKDQIISELSRFNSSIKSCETCKASNLVTNGYFGNFPVADQAQFQVKVTTNIKHENIFYLYLLVIFVLFSFSFFNKSKLRKIIKETISNPLEALVQKIKVQGLLESNPKALYEINYLSSEIELGRKKISRMNAIEKQAALGYLAAAVAHDIRSPLAVMEISMSKISDSISTSHLIIFNQAIQSVRDIANNLLEHYRDSATKSIISEKLNHISELQEDGNIVRLLLLAALLELIISQKRQEWQKYPCNLELIIHSKAKSVWVRAAPNDFKRVVSNLLNNAYESLLDKRSITVALNFSDFNLQLKIKDYGHGIPENKIECVLEGMSLKHSGEGLGLKGAKNYMKSINGSLEILSTCNKGTLISLTFLVEPRPVWCPDTITLATSTIVIIVDDDASMHNFWRHRLQTLGLYTLHFSNSQSLLEWHKQKPNSAKEIIYFIDYELKEDSLNGLAIFNQLNAKSQGYLITSHADEIIIQERCTQLGIWLMPKTLIDEVEIRIKDE